MANATEEQEELDYIDEPNYAGDGTGYALPLWIWGTTAFVAAYMMLQLQTCA